MFDRLAANPASYRSAPSTLAAFAAAVVILAIAAAYLAVLVWGTLHASGFDWVIVGLGWLLAVALRPQSARLPRDARVLDRADFPGIHALVCEMAHAVGTPAPRVVAVDVNFNAYVMPVGVRGRPAMVLGLPVMSMLGWHARLGVIGHELGHLRGRDTVRGRVIDSALQVASGLHSYLAPVASDRDRLYERKAIFTGGVTELLARGIQALLAAPFLVVAAMLDRLSMAGRQHREYLADRRAAEVVGSAAMVEFQTLDLEAVAAAAAAAARRKEDPFGYLLQRPAPTVEQRAARLVELATVVHRADATHPPDDLRIRLIDRDPRPPGPTIPDEIACARAEEEFAVLRSAAAKEFSESLRFGSYD